jgi:Endonuclease NucS
VRQSLKTLYLFTLDRLLNLSPISRQYRIGTEICDILATDNQGKLTIIELKNTEDRYVVQQLTRYYHGLIESKPRLNGIDYRKPVKLVAVAPSFHLHNFIDKIYTTLNFEFFTFDLTANKVTGDVFFELTNVNTKKRHVEQVPQIKHKRVIKSQESAIAEVDYNEMIDYHMRLSYSAKLGLDPLSPEQLRERSVKYRSKCTKEFKINLELMKKTGIVRKSISIKLPSKIRIGDFYVWIVKNVTGGIECRKSKNITVARTRSGVFNIRI